MPVDSLSLRILWEKLKWVFFWFGNSNDSIVWDLKKITTLVRDMLSPTRCCPLKLGSEGLQLVVSSPKTNNQHISPLTARGI